MNQLNLILKKIISDGVGRYKKITALVGLFIAIFLLLTSIQLQINYHNLLNNKNNKDSIANFLVVNKILTDATLGKTAIEDSIIKDIQQQPFTEAVGELTPSKFKASIESNSKRFPFYTDISFESVPKEFVDVQGTGWTWNEQSPFVPIIIPTLFLDFYNFQFSLSQDLPQLTPDIIKMIVFKVSIHSTAGTVSYNAKIVGFSDRISSMIVPQEFLNWGNHQNSTDTINTVSRVIIKTKDPGSPLLSEYLKKHQLTTDADKTRFSKYRKVVDVVVYIAGITGGLLLAFALLVFTLFIQISIASCKEEITLLIVLGASPTQLSSFLIKRFFPINIWLVAGAIIVISFLQYFLYRMLEIQHIYIDRLISSYTFGIAGLLLLLIWWVNKHSIRRYIYQ